MMSIINVIIFQWKYYLPVDLMMLTSRIVLAVLGLYTFMKKEVMKYEESSNYILSSK